MYICKRCGYSSSIKGNLKNHFNRKRICKPILKDIEILVLKKDFQTNLTSGNEIVIKYKNTFEKENKQEQEQELNNDKLFKCDYCGRDFKHRQSKFTHQKKCDGKR